MYALMLLVLAGCAPQPSSIQIASEPSITVHNLSAVPMPVATVLDAQGRGLPTPPVVAWTVSPPDVATISADGSSLEPLGEGTAQVTAHTGAVSASFQFSVRLPDSVELAGLTDGQIIPAGQALPVRAQAMDEGSPLETLAVLWSTSDPSIATVEGGQLRALQAGETTITASVGSQSASVDITVTEPPDATSPEVLEAAG